MVILTCTSYFSVAHFYCTVACREMNAVPLWNFFLCGILSVMSIVGVCELFHVKSHSSYCNLLMFNN